MILQRQLDTFTGYYNFAVYGGAIGIIDLSIPIPANTVYCEFSAICVTPFTSGGAATVAFGLLETDVNPIVSIPGYFIVPTLFSGYGGTSNAVLTGIRPGGTGATSQTKNNHAVSVSMTIAVAAITAGQFQILCRATVFDF